MYQVKFKAFSEGDSALASTILVPWAAATPYAGGEVVSPNHLITVCASALYVKHHTLCAHSNTSGGLELIVD